MKTNTLASRALRRTTQMGILAALSIGLVLLIRFPIFPVASYLEYEPADVPILIGAFLYGPWQGLLLTTVVSFLQALTVSAQSGIAGFIMHVCATGGMVVVAGSIYRRRKTMGGAVLALVLGALTMTALMVPLNLIVTPLFFPVPMEAVVDLLLPAIIPFNLIKGFGNALLTFLLYKRLGRLLKY